MEKFKDLAYKRPDKTAVTAQLTALVDKLEAAQRDRKSVV